MADLKSTRRKMKIAMITMLCVDIVAVILLISPLVGSSATRKQEMQQLSLEERQKTRQVEPLRGLDKKIVLAGQQINEFYKGRLPDKASSIVDELRKVASDTGVKIAQAKYETKDQEEVGLSPVLIEANCQGNYLQLVRFINALERDKTFFIINSVVLGDAQGGSVKLQLKLETYLRTGA
jgi:type IV pilus assembly protein PilO